MGNMVELNGGSRDETVRPPRHRINVCIPHGSQYDINAATEVVNDACSKIEKDTTETDLVISIDGNREIRSWPNGVNVQDIGRWERALRRLERIDAPIVAAISDTCGGPEFDLALIADYRIGSPQAEMCPPMNDGLFWPGMSLYRLVHQCGLTRARQIVLWGKKMNAELCVNNGIFDEISSDLDAAVEKFRNSITLPREFAIRRRLILDAAYTPYEEAIGTQLAACDRELRRMYPRAYGA